MQAADVTALVKAAEHSIADHAWQDAFDSLAAADQSESLPGEQLNMLAEAAFWSGHAAEALDARQRAYMAYVETGRPGDAANAALMVCGSFFLQGDTSAAAGWLGRAQRLLEDLPECSAHAFMAWLEGQLFVLLKDHGEALKHAKAVEEIATRVGDRDLVALGVAMQGFVRLHVGEVSAGLRLLDEALAAATAGELGPFATAEIFCEMVVSSLEVADYERAARWLETAERSGREIVCFPGCCRAHRATVLRHRGEWPHAEREALQARVELAGAERLHEGMALTEIGELHRCKGELALAENAFSEAYEKGWPPQPGLARVLVAKEDLDGAKTMIQRSVEHSAAEPGALLRLLPAQVEIALATGDFGLADAAAHRLDEVTANLGTSAAHAANAAVKGLLLQHSGDPSGAAREFESSVTAWLQARSPYEAAQVRMRRAEALANLGDEASARLELATAQRTFERLGAAPDAREVARRLGTDASTIVSRTFMFTDIVNSTALLTTIGDEAWHGVRRWHDRTISTNVTDHGGSIVKETGDGFFVTFQDPARAVDCAVAIQRAIEDHRRTDGFSPSVRIGLHAGSAVTIEDDYAGRDVVVASRLESVAGVGEILISGDLAQILGTRFALQESQLRSLKGIPEPVEAFSVDWR